jgi:hypothetical protein
MGIEKHGTRKGKRFKSLITEEKDWSALVDDFRTFDPARKGG